jgi:hypothetical protein
MTGWFRRFGNKCYHRYFIRIRDGLAHRNKVRVFISIREEMVFKIKKFDYFVKLVN